VLTEGARKIYHGRRVGQGWYKISVRYIHTNTILPYFEWIGNLVSYIKGGTKINGVGFEVLTAVTMRTFFLAVTPW
jgi:hypothetical protein